MMAWGRCSYLAFDINISVLIKQSPDDLYVPSSDSSDQHGITALSHT